MATKLTRPVIRETLTLDPIKYERIMVRIDETTVTLWQKGRRRKFVIGYQGLFAFLFRQAAHAAQAERNERTKRRK